MSQPSDTAAKLSKPRAAQRATAIPFPHLPADNGAPFWRAAWLRDLAKADAMERLSQQKACARMSAPLRSAVNASIHLLQQEADKSLKYLIEEGGLLYAWLPEGGAQ